MAAACVVVVMGGNTEISSRRVKLRLQRQQQQQRDPTPTPPSPDPQSIFNRSSIGPQSSIQKRQARAARTRLTQTEPRRDDATTRSLEAKHAYDSTPTRRRRRAAWVLVRGTTRRAG
ncbi:hypothetical protein K402DRAFT_269834 [Aulographum hederae CBS 113979]|uniref:Uncharacterized protein n=1 Tax=Aulographum hederae CBS 113979 TaxID=1176131 RepID=A0A6G1H8D7_9PEZI|nr:hypothetical protein K402DRAFT_269834 [Aulographum hederae CBS 113979]